MRELEADLARFYDQQAPQRVARRPPEQRDAARAAFAAQVLSEGRSSVLEVGTGTGRDAVALRDAGLRVSGIDLSSENVRYCQEAGIDCQQGSLVSMPFADGAFEAGWTMSVLMHVPNAEIDAAFAEIARVLAPGAPLAVGVWSGPDEEEMNEHDQLEPKRFFSRRTDATWRATLERHGAIERFESWSYDGESWDYQYAVLRMPS